MRKLKQEIKKRGYLSKYFLALLSLKSNLIGLYTRRVEYKEYHKQILHVIESKKIILDITHGGLGDWLVFTTLPRLLSETYGIDFYISRESLTRIRDISIFKLCFELNPHFKGIQDTGRYFKFNIFPQDKLLYNFITDQCGASLTEIAEKQFGLAGPKHPELYYKPKLIDSYKNTVLVDKNYISGKKLGWLYSDHTFQHEIEKVLKENPGAEVVYIDPKKQDLCTYIDMMHSCAYFITVLSGGAALAAAYQKPFTAILPKNIYGGSVDNFIFKTSTGTYIR